MRLFLHFYYNDSNVSKGKYLELARQPFKQLYSRFFSDNSRLNEYASNVRCLVKIVLIKGSFDIC